MATRKKALDPEVVARADKLVAGLREAPTLDGLAEAIAAFARDEQAGAVAGARVDWTRLRSFGGKRPEDLGEVSVLSWDGERVLLAGEDGLLDLRLVPRPEAPAAAEAGGKATESAALGEPASEDDVAPPHEKPASGPDPVVLRLALEAALVELDVRATVAVDAAEDGQGATFVVQVPSRKVPYELKLRGNAWKATTAARMAQLASQIATALGEG